MFKGQKIVSRKRFQLGSTLIETMVSLFILAVGLLGALALQVKGVNSTQRAQFSTDANILADDMANRIYAYMRNLDVENKRDSTIFDDYSGIDSRTSEATNPACGSTGCSVALQRQLDEWEWSSEIKSRLPDGVGTVGYSGGAYEITIMWNNEQIENPTANCSGSGNDLTCFVYKLKLE